MGMTIEQDIKVIRKMLAYTDLSVRANLKADMIDACEDAIDTMRKYQKIQEIIKDWEDGHFSDVVGCLRVKAVLDGNDD